MELGRARINIGIKPGMGNETKQSNETEWEANDGHLPDMDFFVSKALPCLPVRREHRRSFILRQ